MLTIRIHTYNAAFCDENEQDAGRRTAYVTEVKRLLQVAARKIESHYMPRETWEESLSDINGNKVGTIKATK